MGAGWRVVSNAERGMRKQLIRIPYSAFRLPYETLALTI